MKRVVTAAALAAQLAACATAPSKISGSYVSPAIYTGYDCAQLRAEMQRIAYKVDEVTGAQQSKARNDEIAMGVGLVLFWPALFFLAAGSDRKAELRSLKGSYEAVSEASIMHKCGLSREPQQAAATDAPARATTARAAEVTTEPPKKPCAIRSLTSPDAVTC